MLHLDTNIQPLLSKLSLSQAVKPSEASTKQGGEGVQIENPYFAPKMFKKPDAIKITLGYQKMIFLESIVPYKLLGSSYALMIVNPPEGNHKDEKPKNDKELEKWKQMEIELS